MATARLLFLFGTRNRACGELAGNPKNIPPLFRFISGLSELLPSTPSLHPALFIQPIILGRVFSHVPICAVSSRFPSLFELGRREKKTAARLLPRKGPFYLRAEDPSSL